MSYRQRTKHLPDPDWSCRCGLPMRRAYRSNSGTTVVSQICPAILAALASRDFGDWDAHPAHGPTGHQWIVVTREDHPASCCSGRWVETAGRSSDARSPYWPYSQGSAAPDGVPLDIVAVRAVTEVAAGLITPTEALARVMLAASWAGRHDPDTVTEALTAALADPARYLPPAAPHHCGERHRTAGQVARCDLDGNVRGVGAWAVISECRWWAKPRVSMHRTAQQATAALLRLDDDGCSDRCRDRHRIAHYPKSSTTPVTAPSSPPAPTLYQQGDTLANHLHDTRIADMCRVCTQRRACTHSGYCFQCIPVDGDQ